MLRPDALALPPPHTLGLCCRPLGIILAHLTGTCMGDMLMPPASRIPPLTHLTASGALIAAVPMPMMGMRAPLDSRTCCGSWTGSDAAFAAPAAAFGGGKWRQRRPAGCQGRADYDVRFPLHGFPKSLGAAAGPTCAWPAPLGAGPSHVPVPAWEGDECTGGQRSPSLRSVVRD